MNKPVKRPLSDLERDALEHYEEASTALHQWSSDIPKAIKFYYKWKQLNFWGKLKLTFNPNER